MDFLQGKLTLVRCISMACYCCLQQYTYQVWFLEIGQDSGVCNRAQLAVELIDFKWLDETKLLKTHGPRELRLFQAKPWNIFSLSANWFCFKLLKRLVDDWQKELDAHLWLYVCPQLVLVTFSLIHNGSTSFFLFCEVNKQLLWQSLRGQRWEKCCSIISNFVMFHNTTWSFLWPVDI